MAVDRELDKENQWGLVKDDEARRDLTLMLLLIARSPCVLLWQSLTQLFQRFHNLCSARLVTCTDIQPCRHLVVRLLGLCNPANSYVRDDRGQGSVEIHVRHLQMLKHQTGYRVAVVVANLAGRVDSAPRELKKLSQALEHVREYWLSDVQIKTGLGGASRIIQASVPGHRYQQRSGRERKHLDSAGDIVAVLPWHADVNKD